MFKICRAKTPLLMSLALALTLLLQACGSSTSPHPISVADPLYVLSADGNNLDLQVIDRETFHIGGTIAITQVDSHALPGAAVAPGTGNAVIVTHTGVVDNGQLTLQPETDICSMGNGVCQQVLRNAGSATIDVIGNRVAVPVWSGDATSAGQLAWFSRSSLSLEERVNLGAFPPGAMHVSLDGNTLYWLTQKTTYGPSDAGYELLKYNLSTHQVERSVSFGLKVPGELAITPDGSIYVSITTVIVPGANAATPPQYIPGTTVEKFSSDLTHVGDLAVGKSPDHLAISSIGIGSLAVSYAANQGGGAANVVDIFALSDLVRMGTITTTDDSSVTYLSVLSDGSIGLVAQKAPTQSAIGILNPVTLQVTWHFVSGSVIAPIAG